VARRYGLKLRPLQERARRKEFTHILIGRERFMTDEQIVKLLEAATVTAEADKKRAADLAATKERQARRQQRKTSARSAQPASRQGTAAA
jgi:ribosomal protein L14E/L6E/L27E